MAQLTIDLPDVKKAWVEQQVGDDGYSSIDDLFEDALDALRDRAKQDEKYLEERYPDLPDNDSRRRRRLIELLEEGENSGDAGPWDVEEFLATETKRAAQRNAA